MESVPVVESSGAATSASVCSGALSASLANDEGRKYLFLSNLYALMEIRAERYNKNY